MRQMRLKKREKERENKTQTQTHAQKTGEAANPSTMSVHGALQSGSETANYVMRSFGAQAPSRNWWESEVQSAFELRSKL